MNRRVVITGLGCVSGLGVGVEPLWEGVCAARSALRRLTSFDPGGFDAQIGAEVDDFKANKYVPKSYRKAVKVMARDIELAVGAADLAARHAGLVTPGTDPDADRSYPGPRTGCHIGAGLIAADINELTEALVTATGDDGGFDIHRWGAEGMHQLTPLWLLKYLPNMLACHVTIIHDAQGPSNTITCGEASSALSIGESLRVIQRGNADCGICGGAESKVNPMAFYRQQLTGRLTTQGNDHPTTAVRPFDAKATGTAVGEGGGIVILEAADTAAARGATPLAEVVGFGAGQSVFANGHALGPHPEGRGSAAAIRAALRDAELEPGEIDLIIPLGAGVSEFDRSEASAIRAVFGERAGKVPLWSSTPFISDCFAGVGAINAAVATLALKHQRIPARINCDEPIEGLNAATAEAADADLRHVLVFSTSFGGQNAALILRRAEP